MARLVLALATLLILAGCTSGTKQNSAESSSAQTSASSSEAQPSGSSSAPATGSAGATTALPSAPSLAPNGAVTKSTYTAQGGVWPLTVTDGAISCEFGTQVLFKTSDGTVYAVNDAAKAAGEWNSIEPIRAGDPKNPGHKLPLDDLISSGMALC